MQRHALLRCHLAFVRCHLAAAVETTQQLHSIQPRLQAQAQIRTTVRSTSSAAGTEALLYHGNTTNNGGKPWWWKVAVAGVTTTVAATAACSTAQADSTAGQLQQAYTALQVDGTHQTSTSKGRAEERHGDTQGLKEFLSQQCNNILDLMEGIHHQVEARLTALMQQPSDEPVLVRLLAFSTALMPVILASGLAYKWASGVPLSRALYKMYCLLCRIEAGTEPNFWSYLVSNMVFLLGFFTLAVLLGVVNDEVQRRADDHRHGRNPVKASDHILILNWNKNSPALLEVIASALATAPKDTAHRAHAHGSGQSQETTKAAAAARVGLWTRQPAVVVLADKDKAEMDAVVQEVIRDRGFDLQVHTRQGSPFKPWQLKRVSAQQASIVVLLHPDTAASPADAEAMKAAAAMAFTTLPPPKEGDSRRRYPQRMIVQMPSSIPEAGNVLRSVQSTTAAHTSSSSSSGTKGPGVQVQVLSLPDQLLTNRIVAQTAAQPGVLTCWLDILAPAGTTSNFKCLKTPPDLQQQTYINIRRSFLDDVVCGFLDSAGAVHFNPDETCVPGPGSRLILLSHGSGPAAPVSQPESNRKLYEQAAVAAAQRLQRGATFHYKSRHILVSSWCDDHVPELMRSFGEFAPEGSTVTFIQEAGHVKRAWPKQLGNISKFNFITHPHPASMEALLSAGIKSADCVVIGTGPGQPTDAEADARVLSSLLQVQEAVLKLQLPRAPHVVAPICEAGSSSMALKYLEGLNSSLSQQQVQQQQPPAAEAGASGGRSGQQQGPEIVQNSAVLKPEFLIFPNICSAVLAQAASEPAYADIVAALLFSKEGEEVYLRSPASFNIPVNEPISFAEVQELARLTKQTAIGYITTDNLQTGGDNSATSSSAAESGIKGRKWGVPWAHTAISKLSGVARVHLGLSSANQVVFKEGDWIVVLAADF